MLIYDWVARIPDPFRACIANISSSSEFLGGISIEGVLTDPSFRHLRESLGRSNIQAFEESLLADPPFSHLKTISWRIHHLPIWGESLAYPFSSHLMDIPRRYIIIHTSFSDSHGHHSHIFSRGHFGGSILWNPLVILASISFPLTYRMYMLNLYHFTNSLKQPQQKFFSVKNTNSPLKLHFWHLP